MSKYGEIKEVYDRYVWDRSMTETDGDVEGIEWSTDDYGLTDWGSFITDCDRRYPHSYIIGVTN